MARFIDLDTGTVRETGDREFYKSVFGHYPRTKEERAAEWDAKVEWYVERILAGCEFEEYGNPQVTEAKQRIAARDALDLTVGQLTGTRRAA
jgi:hypothetical protein